MMEEGANDKGAARTKYIGDVLYIKIESKIDDGRVLDADHTDVDAVLREIMSLV